MLYNFEELSFGIISVFRMQHADGFFCVKPRPYAALACRLAGRSEFVFSDKRISAKEGDVTYIPAGMPYEVHSTGSEIVVIHMRDSNYSEAELFRSENPARLRAMFFQLLECFEQQKSVHQPKALVYGILACMENEQKSAAVGSPFEKCLNYMETHFCDPNMEIGEACAAGFISQSGLQRAFHKRFGMSPKEYLGKLRMNKAMQLLLEGERSVKQIAFDCGFSDEKFFSRSFKQKYGFSPSEMKKQLIG